MSFPAGSLPPAPDNVQARRIIHAVDGDGTAVCSGLIRLELIDHDIWRDVPQRNRCPICSALIPD